MSATNEGEIHIPKARQIDYDAYLKDLMESNGLSIEESAEEAIETFRAEYDISGLFLYANKREFDEKVKVETRCKTIEKASKGTDSFVNANFAFQGLIKIIKDSDIRIKEGICHMFESRLLVGSLIQLLVVAEKEIEKEQTIENGDDSDDDDEEESTILQTVAVLEFLLFINQTVLATPQYFNSIEVFYGLDEGKIQTLKSRLDEDVSEIRVVDKMMDVLSFLLPKIETNRSLFIKTSGIDLLELSIKMHKKSSSLNNKVKALIASII